MNFIELDPDTFREFADKSPCKSFMQTPEIAKYREQNGWTVYYLGAEDGGELRAAAMLVAKPTFLGKSTFVCPGGPLLDYENTELANFFFKHLKRYIKSHNGYTLHISPYYELTERTRDGSPKEGGFNRTKAVQNLKNLGFRPLTTNSMPKYLFVLDLQNRTPDQIFADLKRNTRNHIRKAEKMGVKVRELKKNELGVLKQITESTSHRRHFTDQPLSYYQQMYDLLHDRGEVMFLLAEVPCEGAILRHSADSDSQNYNSYGSETGQSQSQEPTNCCNFDDRESRTSKNSISHGTIPLSAAMFILYGDEVIYLFSGSDEKYMKDYNAQYLIQWHMIKYAAEHGYKIYNFYGINGLPDKNSKDYGIYDFKKGFTSEQTGRVVELLGSYELGVNLPFYYLRKSADLCSQRFRQ